MSYRDDHFADSVVGAFLGMVAGGGMGLGACMFYFDEPPFFTGDTVLFGAIVCAALGYLFGSRFTDALAENLWWFW